MGNKFCTACGSALSGGVKFCEHCGAPVNPEELFPEMPASSLTDFTEAPQPPSPRIPKKTIAVIAGIVVVLVITAALTLFVLPVVSSGQSRTSPGPAVPAVTTTIPVTPVTTVVTTIPTPVPDPFPDALKIKDSFTFGSGEYVSEGTVYRVWMNDTYQWHNDMDNKYYPQVPKGDKKYLFVFVDVYNNGTTRVWPPTSNNVKVYYQDTWYSPDPTHYIPDKGKNLKSTAIEVKEIQYYSKLFGSEYVEDYGLSHGSQTAFLYPGKSNAIDGYLIYEVPGSLRLDKTYVQIAFNGNDMATWKLG